MRRYRNRSYVHRSKPSPLMIMISVGVLAAVAALIFWRRPAPSVKKVEATKERVLKAQTQNQAPTVAQKPETSVAPLQSLSASIRGPLPHSLRRVTTWEKARFLSALAARLLIWKVDLRRGLRRGDKIRILYRPVNEQSRFQIEAMMYKSRKHRKTYRFYRFQASNQKFAVYYDEQGKTVEEYLESSPLKTYEQVTSILKMRPRHKGVDFKAPVGTVITLPYRARVLRKNWNTRYNGLCLKVEFLGKRHRRRRVRALFLHLHKVYKAAKPGAVLRAGTPIGEVGNTGRSTAAHLHYQLETRRRRIIDPFRFHRTYQRSLPAGLMEGFQTRRRSLDRRF
ncbi:MAG: M23 family metallopeptidase [Deltaproteobacteria bacterium]|nr:MAG: M23 family metallopeptidase [Deltaproteobacteria bacterium]